MKIGIVIPFIAQGVSKAWQKDCELLEGTVKSVLQQTNKAFKLSVVGHDCPDFLKGKQQGDDDIFVTFSDFAPPENCGDKLKMQFKYELDRCSKILRGVIHQKEVDPDVTHWFAMDADDLIHKDFIDTLLQTPDKDAYLIEKGYFYFKNSNVFNHTDEFFTYCGSSAVVASKFFDLPDTIDETSFKKVPFGVVSHVSYKKYFQDQNMDFHIPQKRLVMYVRESGANISDFYINDIYKTVKQKIGMLVRMKFIDANEKAAFAIANQ